MRARTQRDRRLSFASRKPRRSAGEHTEIPLYILQNLTHTTLNTAGCSVTCSLFMPTDSSNPTHATFCHSNIMQ